MGCGSTVSLPPSELFHEGLPWPTLARTIARNSRKCNWDHPKLTSYKLSILTGKLCLRLGEMRAFTSTLMSSQSVALKQMYEEPDIVDETRYWCRCGRLVQWWVVESCVNKKGGQLWCLWSGCRLYSVYVQERGGGSRPRESEWIHLGCKAYIGGWKSEVRPESRAETICGLHGCFRLGASIIRGHLVHCL